MVAAVVSKLIDQVCQAFSPVLSLIMEPLRRPSTVAAEPRRVPPLRIRLPPKREPRERRPARARDYSPPLPVSRQQRVEEMAKKRAGIAPVETNVGDGRQKR